MTKQELTTLLRSVGVNENTVTAMENAYDMGADYEREACAKECEGWDFVPDGYECTPQQLTENLTHTIARHIRERGQS